ncbi:MAG: class I SAM-dependent methyltransferase [candidate division FCPU426 bacterium]
MSVSIADAKALVRRFRLRYFPDTLTRLLRRELAGMQSVLDLGCGSNSRLQFVPGPERKVGVDAFQPSLDKAMAKGIYHEVHCMPLDQIELPEKSFDAVIALDLVEHFEKPEGLAFISKMESLAKKKVLIFTPNGFLPQAPYEDNPWQEHKSGWDTAELRALGYQVEGVLGLKSLRGEFHLPVIRPHYLGGKLAMATRLWTSWHPEKDAALLAVKECP